MQGDTASSGIALHCGQSLREVVIEPVWDVGDELIQPIIIVVRILPAYSECLVAGFRTVQRPQTDVRNICAADPLRL